MIWDRRLSPSSPPQFHSGHSIQLRQGSCSAMTSRRPRIRFSNFSAGRRVESRRTERRPIKALSVQTTMERWQSGRMRRSRKPLCPQGYREFESLLLRLRRRLYQMPFFIFAFSSLGSFAYHCEVENPIDELSGEIGRVLLCGVRA
jgi:hypothetical protein